MEFKKQKSIFEQIADSLCERIAAGEWGVDERIPSVRDIGLQLSVNPNTVMRSFEYLQQNGIIYNRRGVGYFVAPSAKKEIEKLHRAYFLEEELPALVQKMRMLNLSFDDLKAYAASLSDETTNK